MTRKTLVLAALAVTVSVSVYLLTERTAVAIAMMIASSGSSIFWNVVMTAWEKRQREID